MGCCGQKTHDCDDCGCNDCDCDSSTTNDNGPNCLAGDVQVAQTVINLANAAAVLTKAQLGTGALRITSTPALTANRVLTIPTGPYSIVVFGDASLGAFGVTFTTGAGSTVTLLAGQTLLLTVSASGVAVGF